MSTTPHILVVDDHEDIRTPLARYLTKNGMRASVANGGAEMRERLKDSAPDLVVLDVMMPGEDGLALCRHLRETTDLPVILLTAMSEETDRIVGLEVGADDYLTKPFNPRELLARIKAVLRRTHAMPPVVEAPSGGTITFDQWTLDTRLRELTGTDGVSVALSTAEFRLLTVLLQRPNRVLSREQLLDLTAGRDAVLFDRSIDNQVSRLRKKIEGDPKKPAIIQTVWGGGYKFVADVTSS
jgi:two-component system, OmpR family, response regulator